MTVLWSPSTRQIESANVTRFRRYLAEHLGIETDGYRSLHQWSIDDRAAFWSAVWDFSGVVAERKGERVLVDDRMPGARYFPDARLNFAENLLRRRDDGDAIAFLDENGSGSRLSWLELCDEVARQAQGLRSLGVTPGDRVAAILPNIPESVIAMLACASIGAVWSSCSPDFGVQGVLDRFQQIAPKVLYACDGYFYNGKPIDTLDKAREIAAGLPEVEQVILVPFMRRHTGDTLTDGGIPHSRLWVEPRAPSSTPELTFEPLPFSHPLYILFSSGTTGLPKCIVHSAGGTLLQHLKEHQLHFDVRRNDRAFWFTTLGWMMWNWLMTILASEATILLFDGSPFHPDGNVLFDFANQERMTHMGLSAKYIQAIEKAGIVPAKTHDLSALRVIGSTGSTLLPEGFDYIYRDVKKDVCLSSVSGGTDIVSCFVGGCPTEPVRRGEIQVPGLAMAVEVWDEQGQRHIGEKGELVCTRSFPSMPVAFWNDPDHSRYRSAYFDPDFQGWRVEGFSLSGGSHDIPVPQFYLLEYRDPYEDFANAYNYDSSLSDRELMFYKNNDTGEMEAIAFRYRPGVLAWYYNGEYLWSQNEPAQFGPGNGFLLLVDASPQEYEYPSVPAQYFKNDEGWRYYDFDDDAQAWLEQNFLDVMCFQRSFSYFPVDLSQTARDRCGSLDVPPGEAVTFGGTHLKYSYALINELLPGEDRERYTSMSTMFDVRVGGGNISYRLYDRRLRTAHSADAPFSLQPFTNGLQFYGIGATNELVPTRGIDFEEVSTFSDETPSRYLNPHLPFGSANVPDEGLGFQLAAPGGQAPDGAKVKIYFTWDR